mmetsp:Transcript_108402/g.313218  ORF Transcript_108402/g.313218 Transcript_108402/m.313218 type:complete len:313 (+) Transcript_108402:3-941(+)
MEKPHAMTLKAPALIPRGRALSQYCDVSWRLCLVSNSQSRHLSHHELLCDDLVPLHDPRVQMPVPVEEGLARFRASDLELLPLNLALRQGVIQHNLLQVLLHIGVRTRAAHDIPCAPRFRRQLALGEHGMDAADERLLPSLGPLYDMHQQEEVLASRLEGRQGHFGSRPPGPLERVHDVVDQRAHDQQHLVLPELVLGLKVPPRPDMREHADGLDESTAVVLQQLQRLVHGVGLHQDQIVLDGKLRHVQGHELALLLPRLLLQHRGAAIVLQQRGREVPQNAPLVLRIPLSHLTLSLDAALDEQGPDLLLPM